MPIAEITFERHFSVEALSALWGMSDDFIRRLFLQEREPYRVAADPRHGALMVERCSAADHDRLASGVDLRRYPWQGAARRPSVAREELSVMTRLVDCCALVPLLAVNVGLSPRNSLNR